VTVEMFALPTWRQIPIEDSRAARFADGHYSRQTPGAKGFVAAGRRFALWHEGPRGPALWAVCLNLDPVGALRLRNTMFRNMSGTLSSELVVAATAATFELWERIYKELPSLPLESEIDIEATRRRRSKKSPPGKCYRDAGWVEVRRTPREHGRSAKVILTAACAAPWAR
jgi:hypothetical protein